MKSPSFHLAFMTSLTVSALHIGTSFLLTFFPFKSHLFHRSIKEFTASGKTSENSLPSVLPCWPTTAVLLHICIKTHHNKHWSFPSYRSRASEISTSLSSENRVGNHFWSTLRVLAHFVSVLHCVFKHFSILYVSYQGTKEYFKLM